MTASNLIGRFVLIAGSVMMAYLVFTGEPRLPIDVADGTYLNPCCGVLTLNHGSMNFKNEGFNYVIERDKIGPYVLPIGYVGASAQGFEALPSGIPQKLRLDRPANPQHVELPGDGPGGLYSFAKTDGAGHP